jgi:DNA-binding SARP family transcriptional activator
MEFRILGPLEVWDGGGEVSLGGPKPRALLTGLLLHPNEVVPRDRLIDELWGEDSPEDAAAALRVDVSHLGATTSWSESSRHWSPSIRSASACGGTS